MSSYTGKTKSLMKRLPHFCNPQESGQSMLQLYETFGRSLQRSEEDLYEVKRSHFGQTANNVGSRGFIARHEFQGDLDKIYALYLESLGGTSQVVMMNPLLSRRSIIPHKLFQSLDQALENPDSFKYALRQNFTEESQEILSRFRPAYCLFAQEEFNNSFLIDLLTDKSPFCTYLRNQLNEDQKVLLKSYKGGELSELLKVTLQQFFNEAVLADRSLYTELYTFFEQLQMAPEMKSLRNTLYRDFINKKLQEEDLNYGDSVDRDALSTELKEVEEAESPPKNDTIRFNRLLLQATSGEARIQGRSWIFKTKNIPSIKLVRQILTNELNTVLEVPEDSPAAELFSKKYFTEKTLEKIHNENKDLLWKRRLLLEEEFTFEIEKSVHTYRQRLTELVRALQKGASNRQGMIDITAANLGIVGDDPEARRARRLIEIEEFNPKEKIFASGNIPLYGSIDIENTNPEDVTPKLRISVLDSSYHGLHKIKFTDEKGKSFVIPVDLQAKDLIIFDRGKILRNGYEVKVSTEGSPLILKGKSSHRWTVEIEVEANEKTELFNGARFDKESFEQTVFIDKLPAIKLEVLSSDLTPGCFRLIIPWHIPGFTDNFNESEDHPRNKILSLINKVKAAGVHASVSYYQNFPEDHLIEERLDFAVDGPVFSETHDIKDGFSIDSRLSSEEEHEISDQFITSGVIDYSRFDSANRFT